MASSVANIKEVTVIKPSEPTPSCVLSLSSLDSQLFLRFTIEYLLIYSPSHGSNQRATVARIKSALARAMVRYFPLAGRVVSPTDEEPTASNNLQVVCEAQGALFVEAVSDRCTLSDFERAPLHVTQWRQLLDVHVADVLEGAPPVVVQLTWLKDGAAALGVGFNHCLCDGIGSTEFLNSFADLASGNGLAEFDLNPVWDRHLLDPKPVKLPPTTHRRNPVQIAHPEFNRVLDLSGFAKRFSQERLVPTSICFNVGCIQDLKSRAMLTSQAKTAPSYTSFEVLAAHVWRSWARALDLPPAQTLRLLFSVNVRTRVKPNLPTGFYGNGFVLGCAQSTAKELAENGLGYAAGLVNRAKERVGDEYVRSVVEAVSGSTRACPDSVGVLIVSQWSRMGLERVDFGMGRPVHVGPICVDRYCLFVPATADRSDAVKVMVAVPATAANLYDRLIRSPCA